MPSSVVVVVVDSPPVPLVSIISGSQVFTSIIFNGSLYTITGTSTIFSTSLITSTGTSTKFSTSLIN
jgi:hypothetical protein